MMSRIGSRVVRTPSGQEWRVGRRWIGRPMPRWRKLSRRKTSNGEARPLDAAEVLFSVPDLGGIDDLGAAIVILGAIVVIAIVVVPLLLFGIELILLGLLVATGILGRVILGRPWLVQASPTNGDAEALHWQVTGWRHSSNLIDEVASSLEAGLNPGTGEATGLSPSLSQNGSKAPCHLTARES